MDTDGGGWTVFYRRQDGSQSFVYDPIPFYSTGVASPSDREFLVALYYIHLLTSANSGNNQLLVEMEKAKERAFALYDYFLIEMFGTDPLFYANDFAPYSTAGNPLVAVSSAPSDQDQPTSTCLDIFYSPYVGAGINCHAATPFGDYGNDARGQGITWSSWMGFDLSLDKIEFKVRANHCVSKTNGVCDTCESGYDLIVDPTSGRVYCKSAASSSNVCPVTQLLHLQ